MAFAGASLHLSPFGLQPWQGLERLPEQGRKEGQASTEPFQQLFADYVPQPKQLARGEGPGLIIDRRKKAKAWAVKERARFAQHYGQPYRLLLLHAETQDASAQRAAEIIGQALDDRMTITRQLMPPETSGPKFSLPGKAEKPEARAELRLTAWKTFLANLNGRYDGVLLVVPKGEGDTVNDTVNKRASKIALLRGLQVHAQYLQPIDPDADSPDADFVRRTVRAVQDLAWQSIGMLDPIEDDTTHESAADGHVQAQVTALTVVSVNSTRSRQNLSTTVPLALRLDLQTQQTQAQLLLTTGPTGWLSLQKATVKLQGDTRKMNAKDNKDRRAVQDFFGSILDECQAHAQPGTPEVVLLDADTLSAYWPALYDKGLDPQDLRFDPLDTSRSRLQHSWSALTLLRLRTMDKTGKVLKSGQGSIEVLGHTLTTPRWSESETYLVKNSAVHPGNGVTTFLSIGSNNQQGVRGLSGHLGVTKNGKPLKAHIKGYATPEALEVSVVTAGDLDLEETVHLLSKLRRRYAHYDGWTKLPAPLFFSHVIKEYIPDYDLDDEDDDVSETGTD